MNKDLENMAAEDPFLEHLHALKDHPGWIAYMAWVRREEENGMRELLKSSLDYAQTNLVRGGVGALRLCQKGLDILINEHVEKIKGAQER